MLLAELQGDPALREYDTIILDCPPLLPVTDSLILAGYADATPWQASMIAASATCPSPTYWKVASETFVDRTTFKGSMSSGRVATSWSPPRCIRRGVSTKRTPCLFWTHRTGS